MAFDIAGPEGLYNRVTHMRAAQIRRLASRQRASFSEGDSSARVDKRRSTEDVRWASMLSRSVASYCGVRTHVFDGEDFITKGWISAEGRD